MGLDMYLEKRTYVKQWAHNEVNFKVTVKLGTKPYRDIKPKRISYIIEEVMYWRKANHIHSWFVETVQEGNDDCGEYEVSCEQLGELADACELALANKDNEEVLMSTLPTSSGFFFGDTEYNEYYFSACEETARVIRELLAEGDRGDFYYSSSW